MYLLFIRKLSNRVYTIVNELNNKGMKIIK